MPVIDMPLEQLKVYAGRNPEPVDFDDYWDKGLMEMKNMDAKVELKPAAFEVPFADCFDLYFTGVGGARIHAKYLRPKNAPTKHPAVVMFHGYSISSGEWSAKLNYLAMGYSVAALDCRGQGGLSEDVGGVKGTTFFGHIIRGLDDKPENLLFRHIFLDTAQLAGIVMNMPEVDSNRVGAMGCSQGAGLALACAALEPRIKRIVSAMPFLCDYKRVWEMDLARGAYEEIRTFLRQFDPRHEREDEIFTKLGYIDVQFLTRWIRGQVLMATGLMDTTCPPSTQFAAYNKITSEKNVIVYPDFGHEDLLNFGDMAYQFMIGL
jgi:cephalosporin-C deacetylase